MDIDQFLSLCSSSSSSSLGASPKQQRIKLKLVVESNGQTFEKGIEGTVENLKPLIQKLNTKINKENNKDSKDKEKPEKPDKSSDIVLGGSMNLAKKIAMPSFGSTSSLKSLSSLHLQRTNTFASMQPLHSSNGGSAIIDGKIFGVTLDVLVERQKNMVDSPRIPVFVSKALKHLFIYSLGVEGLFRISGSQAEVQAKKALLDKGEHNLSKEDNPHVISNLVKQFLRELPEPLCTNDLYDAFLAASDHINRGESLEILKKTVAMLPLNNRLLLQFTIYFLTFVARNSHLNLMNYSNLSRVFGPNLFWKKETGQLDINSLQSTSEKVNFLTETFIVNYAELIWGCSSDKTVYIWDSKTKEILHTMEIQEKRPKRMAAMVDSDDQETVWIGGDEGTIQIINAATFKIVHKINNGGWDKLFALTSIGKEIWSSTWDIVVRGWDPKAREVTFEQKGNNADAIASILEVPNFKNPAEPFIWFGSFDQSISIYQKKESKWNTSKKPIGNNRSGIRVVGQGFSSRG
ncbi:RhoGAP domain-containing protein [Cavenderia fasciculata]|uniref:RhoGAP domain-containing protein n=1 Tax=Cavenderia fasciculata TaxID=261658 RepID=F4PSG8_CACFS|nr:RhoGAP domain-containing protein [Cavenderia fasciculata]EGG21498.1 RhoGAP domain-containing protein [Cavenderia fasciculata]|eukprot:XP_004359348.1 RhoGAP domain-containing protein [Cavenderia fasciculata]